MRLFTKVFGMLIAFTFVAPAFAGLNVLEYKGGEMGKVIFDGKLHNEKLGPGKCMECHKGNTPFGMKRPGTEGASQIKKDDHVAGKLCGICHDGTKAFGWQEGSDCTKCHKKEEAK